MTEQKTVSAQISEVLAPFCTELASAQGTIDAANEALTGAEAARGSRQRAILETLATLATKHKYEAKDVNAGVEAAKAAFLALKLNTGEKAVINFLGKAKNAMHPRVAPGYVALYALADNVFSQKKADMEDTRAAYQRAPLMVDNLASKIAKDTGKKLTLPQSETALKKFAADKIKSRRENATAMRTKIAAIKEKITDAKRTFNLPDFDTMIALCDALCAEEVLEDALKARQNAGQLRKGKGKSAMAEVLEGASNI